MHAIMLCQHRLNQQCITRRRQTSRRTVAYQYERKSALGEILVGAFRNEFLIQGRKSSSLQINVSPAGHPRSMVLADYLFHRRD